MLLFHYDAHIIVLLIGVGKGDVSPRDLRGSLAMFYGFMHSSLTTG